MAEHKVLITTSGLGSRLGSLTDFTNKSLVRVGDKPALSHIIENYPSDTKFVITVGHYGCHVKEFLELTYPDASFEFVEVVNYKGENSSLLHSMNVARPSLQCPFIFHVCDSVILDEIPEPTYNWIGAAKSATSEQYRTINVSPDQHLIKINEKGEINYDYAYPGLVGIKDFEMFWRCLDRIVATSDKASAKNLSDCHVLQMMSGQENIQFDTVLVDKWYDIGEPFALSKTREKMSSSIEVLDKVQENIYIVNDHVVKFFHDESLISKRVERATSLSGLVPRISSSSRHFFKYRYVPGNLFADSVTPDKMSLFLDWVSQNMWNQSKSNEDISADCHKFYFEKTKKRIQRHLGSLSDKETIINGKKIPPAQEMLSLIDWEWVCNGIAATIHGDLILDNVIETEVDFVLIDWRQDFAGRLDVGDVYYDLAKLNHNLIFNHELVNQNHYMLQPRKVGYECDILCRKNLIDCQEVLHSFITSHGYDLDKVQLLTSLIWINMSPLHEHPLDKFLFNFGKYNLFRSLEKRGDL